MNIAKTIDRLSPLFSLASGVATVALFRRGLSFAPISAGLAVAAWFFAILFSRLPPPVTEEANSKKRRFARFASRTLVTSLYQNVLIFSVPIWFGSATLFSPNMTFPILLGALALFSCFDGPFAEHVLTHRVRRSFVSGLVLFAVSVPALCVVTHLPVQMSVALSAAGSAFAAAVLSTPSIHRVKSAALGLLVSLIAFASFYYIAVFLPPTPVQCMHAVATTGIVDKDPEKVLTRFPRGTPKVFAHFAVAAPDRFNQAIHFQWYVNGKKRGKPIASKIVGGRKHGFRTWTFLSNPSSGNFRVDLLTAEHQLIGRVSFSVQ